MLRGSLLLLAWLAPLLAFPASAPDIIASHQEDTTTEAIGEVTISGSRGRRSEYIEYDPIREEDYMTGETSIISTEHHVLKRSFEHSISLNEGSVIGDPKRDAQSEETWSSAGDFSSITDTFDS